MKKLLVALFLCVSIVNVFAQSPDLSFEDWSGSQVGPKWAVWGNEYTMEVVTDDVVTGTKALSITANADRDTSDFFLPFTIIPMNVSGKTIRLEGSFKRKDVKEGFAGLFLRLDNAEGQVAFDNMAGQHLDGTADWQQVSIQMPFSEDITSVYVGIIHAGTGTVLFDDLHLYIDGVDFREIKKATPPVFEALQDHQFDDESLIEFDSLTELQESGLYKLGRIWGLMKYYHPAIAKGKYNWDFELFRFIPGYLNALSADQQNEMLTAWVKSFGELSPAKKSKPEKEFELKMNPDFTWIVPSLLGDSLTDVLNQVIATERPPRHYYFRLAPNVGNVIFEHEEAYAENVVPDGGFRLLTLFRFWNQVEYFFPYKYAIGKDWGTVLKEYIRPIALAYREPDFKPILLKLLAGVNDSHVTLQGNHVSIQYFFGTRSASADVDMVEGKWTVVDFYNKEKALADDFQLGDVIEKINGRDAMVVAEEKLPYISASNVATKYRDLNLLRTNDTLLYLTVLRNGKRLQKTVRTFEDGELYFWGRYSKTDSCFSMLNDSVGYFFVGNLKQDYVDVAMIEGMDAKALIIDLRCYPSHFPLYQLGEYLMPEAIAYSKIAITSMARPGRFAFSQELSVGKHNPDYFKGQVIILVNELTQSSAEFHAMAWRQAPGAIVVGSQTAGADGNVSTIVLPGGITTQFSGAGVYYPDGRETQRVGIIPDVEVHRTIEGVKAGRDEILVKALSLVK